MRTAVEVGLPVEQTREKLKWRPIMDIRNERRADRANTLKILEQIIIDGIGWNQGDRTTWKPQVME